jgi:hypothetical protein
LVARTLPVEPDARNPKHHEEQPHDASEKPNALLEVNHLGL